MYIIGLALFFGIAIGFLSVAGLDLHPAWGGLWGLLGAVAMQLGLGWRVRKRIQREMELIQAILENGQRQLQHKVAQWQTRPPGSVKQAQKLLERDQNLFLEKALQASQSLDRFRRWSPLINRQTATLRMQLHYQKRDYAAVDRLLPDCLMLDPVTMSMKLAQMYRRKASLEDMEKVFRKFKRRLRYGQGAILYALYAWILLRRDEVDAAFKLLKDATERMNHEVIARNRDHLANNRVKRFSNAGLGDEWYALGLETPKIQAQRRRPGPGQGF